MTTMRNKIWDKIGICASSICLVHCLATPVLLLFFPGFRLYFSEHSHIHEIFAVIVVSSILLAVYPHCRKHGHKDIIAIALVGITLILSAVFLAHHNIMLADGLTIFGSFFLIFAHVKNMKVRHGKCLSSQNKPSCSHK